MVDNVEGLSEVDKQCTNILLKEIECYGCRNLVFATDVCRRPYNSVTYSVVVLCDLIAAKPSFSSFLKLTSASISFGFLCKVNAAECRCYGAVPSLTTLATVRCQSTLSSEALMSCVGLTLSFHDAHKLSRYFSL